MEQYQREFFIARLRSECVRLRKLNLTVKNPSESILYRAEERFMEVMEECKNEEILSEDEALSLLLEKGVWTEKHERDIETAHNNIKKLQIGLFKNYTNIVRKKEAKEGLKKYREILHDLYKIKYSYSHLTDINLANVAKWTYIIKKSTYKGKRRYQWGEFSVQEVLAEYQNNLLTEAQIRELARTEPWTSMNDWVTFKNPWFEQFKLLSWTRFYENIRQASDVPSQDIIEDDDALDGWLHQRGKEGQKFSSKIESCDEIFVVASRDGTDGKPTIDEVYNMNDVISRSVISQRMKYIKEKGTVKESELPDVKRNLDIRKNNAAIQAAKRKGGHG